MLKHPTVETNERVEIPVNGPKGNLLVIAHVDDEGFPVVTVISDTKEENDSMCIEDVPYNGKSRGQKEIHGQLQVTIKPYTAR